MKKVMSTIVAISMILASVPVFAINGGTGTESNPYLISSANDIAKIHNDLDGYYKLTADINMSGVAFEPIGNENEGAFTGTIDGAGYTISNLNINLPENKYVGFVGYLEGTVKNLNLVNVDASGYRYVGGIVGYAENGSLITQSELTGTITGNFQVIELSVGGIVGYSEGLVSYCENNGLVSGNDGSSYVGGITGRNYGKISNCNNNKQVTSSAKTTYAYAGGITGFSNGTISNCNNYAKVEALSYYHAFAGGISGYNGEIFQCVNVGNVRAYGESNYYATERYAGGICGYMSSSACAITESTNNGIVENNSEYTGGVAGYLYSGIITNSYNNANIITAHIMTGGICGGIYSGKVIGCINRGAIEGSSLVGGISGYAYDTSNTLINDCRNFGNVQGGSYVGGIVGAGEARNCVNDGDVSGNGDVGGIIGKNYNGSYNNISVKSTGVAYNCLNSGEISGTNNVGGVCGGDGSIAYNCKNTGTINAESFYDIAKETYIIELSDTTVELGKIKKIPIELYGYDNNIVWNSDNDEIVSVDESGMITGKKIGRATVKATTELGITASAVVNVVRYATSVTLNKETISLVKGDNILLSAQLAPSDSSDTITWTTSDEKVCDVKDGVITAVDSGVAVVTATATSGSTATCTVTVKPALIEPTSIVLSDTFVTLAPEDAKALTATILPSNATETSLLWTSSNEDVAKVNNSGIVTAVSEGFAIIKATAVNGVSHQCVIKVISASGSSVILSDAKASPDDTVRVKASLVKNPGISGYKFTVNYDETLLTPVEITPNSEFGGSITTNLEDSNRKGLNIVWYANEDVTVNGELFTIDFKVSDTAEYGDESSVSIEYGAKDICNTSGEYFALYINDATISIEEPLPGDVYEDGEVTIYDLTLLSRYITSLETFTERQEEAADVNNDDLVNVLDVIKMAQYLTGWSNVELMSVGLFSLRELAAPVISVGSASVNAANEAEIPVYIKGNTGIAAYKFILDYNEDDIEILSITSSELIIKENFKHNLGAESQAEDGLIVTSHTSGGNMTEDGVLFTIKVRYKNPTDTSVSPISIVDNFDNIGNENAAYVTATYETGYALGSDYIVTNKVVGDTNFSCELYFDDSYAEQSAKAIIAFYDSDGRMVQLMPKNITVKPGKVDLSIDYDKKAYATYKLMIWEGMNSLKPITEVK